MICIIFGILFFGVTGVIVKNNSALSSYKSIGRINSIHKRAGAWPNAEVILISNGNTPAIT
ncbi:MAG: hypothetical protein ABIN25_07420 [Ginsengibacter sp.]